MRSSFEYRQRAKDCRDLAKGCDGDRRQQTLEMAETWEDLARQVDSANNRHLAGMIKATYDNVADEPVPEKFKGLLKQLEAADSQGR